MKKTKIICSIGPVSSNVETMTQLVNSGMNVARINFSHATKEEREQIINCVKEVRNITKYPVGILFDTKGPDFRTGDAKEEGIKLIEGNTIRITKEECLGCEEKFTVNYKDRIDHINIGATILLEDGLMKLEVIDKNETGLICKIINGGILKSKKGIAVPGINFNTEFLSNQDKEDIIFACQNDGDFLALSFVEKKEDILSVRNLLKETGAEQMRIISKIENRLAINNLDEIIDHSDGIMIARGDLGVEVPMEELPILQKMIIKKCRKKAKLCIVATEMLASMYTNSRPTRAEITDIANAVLDGTDAVMLSGETTIGKHPIEAVKYMSDIALNAEKYFEYNKDFRKSEKHTITDTLAKCVITSSAYLDAKLIVANTTHGGSARRISNLKPKSLILANCPNEKIARTLTLNWGVYTNVVNDSTSTDDNIKSSINSAHNFMELNKNDVIVITGGFNNEQHLNISNFLKIEVI